jgi:hypothetical protein
LRKQFVLALLFVGAAFAQTPQDELRSRIGAVRYPPLAEAARVQGNVHLSLKSGVVTFLSGPPLLAGAAIDSTKAFASISGGADLDVTYRFVLVDTTLVPIAMTVKKGDAFDRAVLRMFGFKTEKVVLDYRCQRGVAPPERSKPFRRDRRNPGLWEDSLY